MFIGKQLRPLDRKPPWKTQDGNGLCKWLQIAMIPSQGLMPRIVTKSNILSHRGSYPLCSRIISKMHLYVSRAATNAEPKANSATANCLPGGSSGESSPPSQTFAPLNYKGQLEFLHLPVIFKASLKYFANDSERVYGFSVPGAKGQWSQRVKRRH